MGVLSTPLISGIAIIIAVCLFIILCYKGIDLIPTAILCSVVVALTTKLSFFDCMFGPFLTETSSFLCNIFFPFIAGGILGSVMLVSGCSMSVGKQFVRWFGAKRAPYVIMIITIILQLAGIATTPFIVVPIAISLLKEANLPKRVGLAASMGTMYSIMVTMPGTAAVTNLMPTAYLGTTTMAAPLMGFACFAFSIILLIIYIEFLCRDARRLGQGFDGEAMLAAPLGAPMAMGPPPAMAGGAPPMSAKPAGIPSEAEKKGPNFVISVIPIIIVVGGTLLLQSILGDAYRAVTVAQIAASVFIIITCRKHFTTKISAAITSGIKSNIEFILGICLVVGFAGVVQNTTAYDAVLNWVSTLNIHPYLLTVISCALICAICANGYGGMGVFLAALSGNILAMPDVNPQAVHRLTCMTSNTFDSLPHCSAVQINLGIWKMSVKEGYKYCFVLTVLIPIAYTLLGLVLAMLFY